MIFPRLGGLIHGRILHGDLNPARHPANYGNRNWGCILGHLNRRGGELKPQSLSAITTTQLLNPKLAAPVGSCSRTLNSLVSSAIPSLRMGTRISWFAPRRRRSACPPRPRSRSPALAVPSTVVKSTVTTSLRCSGPGAPHFNGNPPGVLRNGIGRPGSEDPGT